MRTHFTIQIDDMDVTVYFADLYSPKEEINSGIHEHLNYEIHHAANAPLTYLVNNRSYVLDENSFLIIPPNTLHHLGNASAEARRLSFEFSISKNQASSAGAYKACHAMLSSEANEPLLIELPIPELNELQTVFDGKYTLPHGRFDFKDTLISSYIRIIITKLLYAIANRSAADIQKISAQSTDTAASSPRIIYINQYITTYYNASPSIETLADELHLSVRQTGRLIKTEMHSTFSRLLIRQRIKIARHKICDELQNTLTPSYSKIAESVGFSNYYTFLKQFKIYTGIIPTEYARLHSEKSSK